MEGAAKEGAGDAAKNMEAAAGEGPK